MVRTALGLVVSLMLAGALAAGPAVAADAPSRCRAGYQLRKKRGVRRCVRKPDEPKPPRDAVTPSSIELIVGTLKEDRFGATGFMRFAGPVTGTAYGEWVLSNGVTRERIPFKLPNIVETDYTPFTIGYPVKVFTRGRAVTARLVIGGVSSNRITLKQ
jgi:hypothetical protein